MERKNNVINTNENPKKNFSKVELEKCNYYKNQFKCTDKECYALIKEDRAIKTLEKTCNILTWMIKVQAVITLVLLTFAFMNNAFPNDNIQNDYKKVSAYSAVEADTKI